MERDPSVWRRFGVEGAGRTTGRKHRATRPVKMDGQRHCGDRIVRCVGHVQSASLRSCRPGECYSTPPSPYGTAGRAYGCESSRAPPLKSDQEFFWRIEKTSPMLMQVQNVACFRRWATQERDRQVLPQKQATGAAFPPHACGVCRSQSG